MRSFVRNRAVDIGKILKPLVDGEIYGDSFLACDLGERRDKLVPSDHLRDDLEILARDFGAVVKGVPGKVADVFERDERSLALAQGSGEDIGAVIATSYRAPHRLKCGITCLYMGEYTKKAYGVEHVQVRSRQDAVPGHVAVTDNRGLCLHPIRDTSLAIVMFSAILWVVS